MLNSDLHFQRLALEQAKKAHQHNEVPIGAVIVYKDEVIATGFNSREKDQNPLGHAEMTAISEAAKKLNSWRLLDTTLYVTVEPCLMCAGAIYQARIKRVVFGCPDLKAGAVKSLYKVLEDKRLNHRVEVTSGVLETECRQVIQQFFENIRR